MATKRKANEAKFYFFSGNLDAGTFEVLNFSGTDRVSSPYEFRLMLISKNDAIPASDVINKQSTLFMYRDEEFYPYSGIVTEFQFVDKNTDYCTYSVTLNARMWLLNLNVQTRVFQKMKVPDIIKRVLEGANLGSYCSMNVDNSKYPEQEYVVQYQESDLNFISRLMEENGIWYFFKELPLLEDDLDGKPGEEQVIITDDPAKFEFVPTQSDILYRPQSGLTERVDEQQRESVHRFQQARQIIPREVLLKNYNYRTPEVDLSSKKTISAGDAGSVYEYGGHYKDAGDADRNAKIAADRIAGRQVQFEGSGNCQGFRAGSRFNLTEHFRDEFNATFVITEVRHAGGHTSAGGSATTVTYVNHFHGITSDQADTYVPERRASVPRINGVMTALIEANGSDYAALDDQGRYKVRMPFDLSDSQNYGATKYLRLAQPYAGANYGMHFPSHEGAEMVFGCIDGDPNKPLGLGTVPNANTISPVVSSNKEQGVIRTAGGNEFVMDDTDGKQKIRLTTKGAHVVEQDDENKLIRVQTTDGNALVLDDANKKSVWNADKFSIALDYNEKWIWITTADGHVIRIDDASQCVTIQSSAGHMVELDDQAKTVTLTDCNGKNKVQLDASKGLILESQAKISIKATQDLEISAANIKMSTTSGKIDVKATQDLNLSGMKINEKATTDLKMEGLNITEKASLNAKIEGSLGVEIKSSLQTKVSGTMTELSGQAMTTIKGGIVMIN